MKLNAEQLAQRNAARRMRMGSLLGALPDESDYLDTVADLQRQLAERDAAVRSLRHLLDSRINNLKEDSEFRVCLDLYVQQRVDEAVLAEDEQIDEALNSPRWITGTFNGWWKDRLAAARSCVQGKPEPR